MKQIKIGRIAGAQGLRGEVKLYHESGDAESLSRASSLFLCPGDAEKSDSSKGASLPPASYEIISLRMHGRTPILTLAGVSDRNAAEALIGSDVYVDEDEIRPTEADAFLVSDLVGISVIDAETGAEIGRVKSVIDNPAHDLLEVKKNDGAGLLIPMVDVYIKEIDTARGRILAEVKLLLQSD